MVFAPDINGEHLGRGVRRDSAGSQAQSPQMVDDVFDHDDELPECLYNRLSGKHFTSSELYREGWLAICLVGHPAGHLDMRVAAYIVRNIEAATRPRRNCKSPSDDRVGKPDELRRCQNDPVFVGDVELVKANESVISSGAWLQILDCGQNMRSSAFDFLQALFEDVLVIPEGETGMPWVLTAEMNEGAAEEVERGSQVVSGVPDDQGDFCRHFLADFAEYVKSTTTIFCDDAVWILRKKLGENQFELSDVSLCSFDFEAGAGNVVLLHDH